MTVNVGASVGVTNGQINLRGVTMCISFGMNDLCTKELKGWSGVGARKEEATSAFILHINDNSFCGPPVYENM